MPASKASFFFCHILSRSYYERTYWYENKQAYIAGAGGLFVGSLAALVYISKTDVVVSQAKIQQILSYKPLATIEVYIEALGDPGNIIQDTTTGIIYASQGQAAKELGVYSARISEHLVGKLPDVKGHTFQKLGKAMVSKEA